MAGIATAIRRYFQDWSIVDPAVALGLFGTGVGLAVPRFPAGAQPEPGAATPSSR